MTSSDGPKPPPPPPPPPSYSSSSPSEPMGGGSSTASNPNVQSIPKPSIENGNPVFRMMGLPNLRLRLPSRNWLIFLSLTTTLTSAILYDRREKKRATQRWAKSVSHIAAEPLQADMMPRRITVYVASPPGDGGSVRAGRELFHEYVRPVLMAGGMDWDVVEGRREGDVREALAGRVRRYRKRKDGEESGAEWSGFGNGRLKEGVAGEQEQKQKQDPEEELRLMRQKVGIKEWEGVAGDIVIGRHTWKEYIRGLHEGWLGPLEAPERIDSDNETALAANAAAAAVAVPTVSSPPDDASPTSTTSLPSSSLETSTPTEKTSTNTSTTNSETSSQSPSHSEKPKSRQRPSLPYIYPAEYPKAPLPTTISADLGPSTALPFPHILGFLNTPIRLKRFLMRRRLADEIGREVAGVVLSRSQEFEKAAGTAAVVTASSLLSTGGGSGYDDASPVSATASKITSGSGVDAERERKAVGSSTMEWGQAHLLEHEEADWPSAFRKKRYDGDEEVDRNKKSDSDSSKESVWVDEVVLDDRIAGRMRRFVCEGRMSGDDTDDG